MLMWVLVPIGYLFGSVSAAIIVCRCMGLPDPRDQGSKNPGATNVLRYGGKMAAGMTLFCDMLKGFLPVFLAATLNADPVVVGAIGISAFLGHLYPIFFGFKGGKGAATAAGAFFGYYWGLGVIVIATWLVFIKLTRVSSLSAIIAATSAPLYAWLLIDSAALVVATLFISLFTIWRHRINIKRLLSGEEGRIF